MEGGVSTSQTESFLLDPFEGLRRPSDSRVRQIWAVGGGKGGVGKSLIASSLSLTLARQSHKIVAVDLDLGGANLHTTLGVDLPKQSLSDFLSGRTPDLSQCVVPTGMPHLELISGARDSIAVANLDTRAKIRLLQSLLELDADYVLLDLGAGTTLNTMDFFLFSDIGIVTLVPEPTSIENAYRFIKSAYYRRLLLSPDLDEVRHLIVEAIEGNGGHGIDTPSDLFREVNKQSPECAMRLKSQITRFKPKLLVNQARTQTDVEIGLSVKSVCKKYFGIEMDYVGYLDHDSAVWQAVRRKRPLMLEFPNSKLVSSFERVTQYLLKKHGQYRNDLW